ncbi:hypothetical protein ACFTWH_10735 [Streptomyces sp. NPDC057011]|uniref:hypothetical protein n=1 Tax=unclassified Streptomyces TaxID=2593676 RepID=UPI00362CDC3B
MSAMAPEGTGGAPAQPPRVRARITHEQAGPAPLRGPGRPLALGPVARARLGGAVRTLIEAHGAVGDAIRLAAVVLAARTPAATGRVEIRTRELGRWLGLSESYVASVVIPGLRRAGIAEITSIVGPRGETRGLQCKLLPMWRAQTIPGHALALNRKELATLLRLLEGLFAPGWSHCDGRVTPAGLLGARTGRGAATDRLALLLLVLEATETGRVRMCAGKVAPKRGRAAVTLARRLGCSDSAGERILARLAAAGVIEKRRIRTASGLGSRTHLILPAVAAAHAAGAKNTRIVQIFSPDGTAGPDQDSHTEVNMQLNTLLGAEEAVIADPDAAAALHPYHPPVAEAVDESPGNRCLSGDAVVGNGRLPERASAREENRRTTPDHRLRSVSDAGGPLRGAKHQRGIDQADQGRQPWPAPGAASRAVERPQRPRTPRPPDDLLSALAPVHPLWRKLHRTGARRRVLSAVRAELAELTGLAGPERAADLLADRLTRRLAEQGGPDTVADPVAWMLRRGLPRRGCTDVRCDEGARLDDGSACGLCDLRISARRQHRRQTAAAVRAESHHLDTDQTRAETEARLRRATLRDIAEQQLRHHAFAETHIPRSACRECSGRILLAGEALATGLCKPCRAEHATYRAPGPTGQLPGRRESGRRHQP